MAEPDVLTVLFTDIVGSTQLLTALGDDAADQVRRTHFALLRRAVADHRGREIKGLGDGLMVAFPRLAARVGVEALVVLGAAFLLLRALALLVVHDPVLVALTMTMHGAGFALLLVGGVTYVARHAPVGAAATGSSGGRPWTSSRRVARRSRPSRSRRCFGRTPTRFT